MIPYTAFAFIDGLGGGEVLMIAFIALILFGGKNLPSLARTAGRTMREFKKASSEVQRELRKAIDEAPDTEAPPSPVATVAQAQRFPSQPPVPLSAGQIDPAYEASNPLSSPQPSSSPGLEPVSGPVQASGSTPGEPRSEMKPSAQRAVSEEPLLRKRIEPSDL